MRAPSNWARNRGPPRPVRWNSTFRRIEGIGGSLIYLVDRYGERTIYDVDFVPVAASAPSVEDPVGLTRIDHLTHNVRRGNMNLWAGFYEKLFNFKEIRYFSIEGKETGLFSRALTSPCGKIRIPINESQDDKSQIEEYLNEYKGEGIQHIALGTDDIYRTVDALRKRGVEFQDTPDTYYEGIDARVAGHRESLNELKSRACSSTAMPPAAFCCRYSPRTPSARSFSKSSSARVMTASAKGISKPCSSPSSSIKSAAA